jgi:hypothetical protein
VLERATLPWLAAPRAPCIPADRFANDDDAPDPNRFQLPAVVPRAELKLDLVIALREAIDAAPYREDSRLFG